MEELKKRRTVCRKYFCMAENDVLIAFNEKRSDISVMLKYFEEKAEDLLRIDDEIKNLLCQGDLDEDIFKDLEIAEDYRRRFYMVREKPDLKRLLMCLEAEVKSEERILVAKEGFDVQGNSLEQASGIVAQPKKSIETKLMTRIFCQNTHSFTYCSKLSNLSMDEKKALLKEMETCFICMRAGHEAQACCFFLNYLIWDHRNFAAGCLRSDDIKCIKDKEKPKNEITLVNIIVLARVNGSQNTYMTQNFATGLIMKVSQNDVMKHWLFGDIQSKSKSISHHII